jgi:hypothetical protein
VPRRSYGESTGVGDACAPEVRCIVMEGSVEVERIIRTRNKWEGRIDIYTHGQQDPQRFVAYTQLYRTHSTRCHGKRCHVVVGLESKTGRIPEFFGKGKM